MIKPELYKKTVDILYQAYFNDTLEHENCYACAVGNMVCANMNKTMRKNYGELCWVTENEFREDYPSYNGWAAVFCSGIMGQEINPENYKSDAKKQIDSTGYSWKELAAIERAFENVSGGLNKEDKMFNGLVSVLECLKEIHQISEEDSLESIKLFKVHYQGKNLERGVTTEAQ